MSNSGNRTNRLWNYLCSWNHNGTLLGQAVSYWEWSPFVVAPHSMHNWPVAFGLISLYERFGEEHHLIKAKDLCKWYLEDRLDDYKGLEWAGGETPRKPTGDILQSAPILALAKLAVHDPKGPWLKRALELREYTYEKFWNGRTVSYVGNHAAYMLAAEGLLSRVTGAPLDEDKIGSMISNIERTIVQHGSKSGAICQADFDARVFDIYVGKAVFGLSLFYLETGDKRVLNLLQSSSEYLKRVSFSCLNDDFEGFDNWRPKFGQLRAWGMLRRFDRKLSWSVQKSVVGLRDEWTSYGPRWIARGSLVAIALHYLGMIFNDDSFNESCEAVNNWIEKYQDDTGGIPNSTRFMGVNMDVPLWQDVVRPVRWNSYVFLSWCLSEKNGIKISNESHAFSMQTEVQSFDGKSKGILVESDDLIEYVNVFPTHVKVDKKAINLDYTYTEGNQVRPEYKRNWKPNRLK